MILSNLDIESAVAEGVLRIRPFDKSMLRACGIDLTLGSAVYVQKAGLVIDLYKTDAIDAFERISLTEERPFKLQPNSLILAETSELVGLSPKLGAFIDGRSTLARWGISIIQSATLIEPGHGWPNPRPIVLELRNGGLNTILLYPKMKIAKLIVMPLVTQATFGYDDIGKYATGEVIPKPLSKINRNNTA
jgi:dCTP deaminase